MKTKLALFAFICLLASCACGTGKTGSSPVPGPAAFPEVNVPVIISQRGQQATLDFLLENYWNSFFDTSRVYSRDTSVVMGVRREDFLRAVSDYAQILNFALLDPDSFPRCMPKARASILSLLSRAEQAQSRDTLCNVFKPLCEDLEKCLYDPNSPLRNEDLYGVVAGTLAGSSQIDPVLRGRYEFQAMSCGLNATSQIAADFVFRNESGKDRTLHSVKAGYTILFFSNPGCNACKDIIGYLSQIRIGSRSRTISEMIASGDVAVINMYIDSDLQAWRDYASIYPQQWYNVYDPQGVLCLNTVYSIRAIPSLYLLDKDKKVLFKDATPEKVAAYLDERL